LHGIDFWGILSHNTDNHKGFHEKRLYSHNFHYKGYPIKIRGEGGRVFGRFSGIPIIDRFLPHTKYFIFHTPLDPTPLLKEKCINSNTNYFLNFTHRISNYEQVKHLGAEEIYLKKKNMKNYLYILR